MAHAYKGFKIVKQSVGPMGWNITRDGKCTSGMTGFSTLKDARDWINDTLDGEEIRSQMDETQ